MDRDAPMGNDGSEEVDGNAIANIVLDAFHQLPQKFKPRQYPNGRREWTTLSGIVVSSRSGHRQCIALGTGAKCLSASKLLFARGGCLHDWHAEVVAIRALNRFLLQECTRLAGGSEQVSDIICRRTRSHTATSLEQPFAIKDDVDIDMYISDAPCGDASMELVMSAQEDTEPWNYEESEQGILPGRGYFSKLGVVRRKPSRADAPQTNSKSCSDKLALKQSTSLLSSLTSLLLHPENAYLRSIVIPISRYVPAAVKRVSKSIEFHPGLVLK